MLPVPHPTPETQPFWDGTAQRKLVIQQCAECSMWVFHPRLRCDRCGCDALVWTDASGRGRLWSYIIVHRPEPGFEDRAPYALGIIELAEGPHLMGSLAMVDPTPESLRIDMPVVVDFEPRGEMFVPVWRVDEAAS
ncbi:hypothetical protein ASD65_13145 [Microbacterium sp. Root61]|nr:hypothetical protein ASD65_13145 [Microbacterium sp. Root61]